MLVPTGAASTPDVQTVVLIRHGEKPSNGLGQLSCRGLNRSLALPAVIGKLFGKPDAIFAPNPSVTKPDHFIAYAYVRPLATVEPTAIRYGLPVETQFGYTQIPELVTQIEKPRYRKALVLVAWEHVELVKAARKLMADNGGDPGQVPSWGYGDYDGIYVVRIQRDGKTRHASFERLQEHLDGQPEQCPGTP